MKCIYLKSQSETELSNAEEQLARDNLVKEGKMFTRQVGLKSKFTYLVNA
jgi:hypothetical protein